MYEGTMQRSTATTSNCFPPQFKRGKYLETWSFPSHTVLNFTAMNSDLRCITYRGLYVCDNMTAFIFFGGLV